MEKTTRDETDADEVLIFYSDRVVIEPLIIAEPLPAVEPLIVDRASQRRCESFACTPRTSC